MKSSTTAQVKTLVKKNTQVENQVQNLNIPSPLYSAVKVSRDTIDIAEIDREKGLQYSNELLIRDPDESVVTLLKNEAKKRNIKYIAVDVEGDHHLKRLKSSLWLDEDIVPYVQKDKKTKSSDVYDTAREVLSYFNEDNLVYIQVKPNNEVDVADLVSLEDYRDTCSPEDFEMAQRLAREFKGKKLVFLNATPQGGGVALMRHALIRFYNLLGVDAKWYVMIPKSEAFAVTKTKFHNVLQAVAPDGVELTEDDKEIYDTWVQENSEKFSEVFSTADVIVVDDPQPSGLIPYIKKINPNAKIIFRSHIQIVGKLASTDGTPQRKTWSFIWDRAKHSDVFVSHPIKEFIPSDVPKEKIVYMPATTDPLDGLNKPLKEKQMDYYMRLFNRLLIVQEGQTPLDRYRPYIVQIARFDPSKGIPDVIESYRILVEMLSKKGAVIPQLVIAGNASIDDPDGVPIYTATIEMLKSKKYAHLAKDIKVARLPHIDQLLNTLLRRSHTVLQLSHKEGFEIKVTEALMKGKPMIAYRAGGMPLQIEEGVNGFLPEAGDTQGVADHLYDLFTNEKLYKKMCDAAERFANRDFLTVSNALCWLFLSVQLVNNRPIHGQYTWVKDLATVYFKKKRKRRNFPFPFLSVVLAGIEKLPLSR